MAEAAVAKEEKKVSIINQGVGPMHTEFGTLAPDQSIEVPESLAKKLTGAYKHIRYAKDIVPAAGRGDELAKQNAELKAKVKELEEQVEGLGGKLKEFLEAGSKKDLDALQEKHADAVPA